MHRLLHGTGLAAWEQPWHAQVKYLHVDTDVTSCRQQPASLKDHKYGH